MSHLLPSLQQVLHVAAIATILKQRQLLGLMRGLMQLMSGLETRARSLELLALQLDQVTQILWQLSASLEAEVPHPGPEPLLGHIEVQIIYLIGIYLQKVSWQSCGIVKPFQVWFHKVEDIFGHRLKR
jgi:hypothetical protein